MDTESHDPRQGGNYTQALPILGPGERCFGVFVGWQLVDTYPDEDEASNVLREKLNGHS